MHGASHTAPAFHSFFPILFEDGDKMEADAREYREEAGRSTGQVLPSPVCACASWHSDFRKFLKRVAMQLRFLFVFC